MEVTLHGHAEILIKQLVAQGIYPSADSAVNSLVARFASRDSGQQLRLPDPIVEADTQSPFPDIPRGIGERIVVAESKSSRYPEFIDIE